MSERKTGATKAQIESAVQIHMTEVGWRQPYHDIAEDQVRRIAERLVRPDERIIALDDLRELVELSWGAEFISEEQSEARERIRALIGDDQ